MPPKAKLRAAVVGLGNIGIGYDAATWTDKSVFSHAKAYQRSKAYELVCGVDSSPAMRARFHNLTGRPAYSKVSECADESLDIVSVCVPTSAHAATIAEVVKNLKPSVVLCEKPLTDNATDARSISIGKRGLKGGLAVNYIRRWQPATYEVARLLKSGKLGRVKSVHCAYSKGVLNNASHAVDLLLLLFGKPRSIAVDACEKSSVPHDVNAAFTLSFGKFDAVFQYGAENGPALFEIDIVTEEAAVHFADDQQFVQWSKSSKAKREFRNEMHHYQLLVMDGIAKSVWNKTKFASDDKSAAAVLKICLEVVSKCKSLR